MSSPKLPPLVPPRPKPPANKALEEHQRAVVQRQSDHEIKVSGDMRAFAEYTKRREAHDKDLARSVVLVARELGIEDQLPPALQSLDEPRLPSSPPRVCENASKSARASTATKYGTAAILVLEIILEVVRRVF